MKKIFLYTFFVILSSPSFPQNILLSQKLKFDTTYQIITLCHFADKKMTYQKFTFLINDVNTLRKVQQEITYGQKVSPGSRNPVLNLCIVRNKEIVDVLTLMPEEKKITVVNRPDSIFGTFEFDLQKLLSFASKGPLDYKASSQSFKSRKELEEFIRKNEKNEAFLCYDNMTSSFEGQFQIVMRESSSFKTSDGFKLIKQEFENNLVPENQYATSFTPCFEDPALLKYTIWTSKKNYDNFNLLPQARSKWQPTVIKLVTYWLK